MGAEAFQGGTGPHSSRSTLVKNVFDKGKNKLGEKGLAYLSKAEWREVIEIFIGNLRIKKVLLLLEIGAADG